MEEHVEENEREKAQDHHVMKKNGPMKENDEQEVQEAEMSIGEPVVAYATRHDGIAVQGEAAGVRRMSEAEVDADLNSNSNSVDDFEMKVVVEVVVDIDIETVYGACEVTDSSTGGFGPDYGEDAESDVVGYEVGVDTGVGAGADFDTATEESLFA